MLVVFDCGPLGGGASRVKLDGDLLGLWEWVPPVSKPGNYLIPRLARRLARAYKAHQDGQPHYLEHGEPILREG